MFGTAAKAVAKFVGESALGVAGKKAAAKAGSAALGGVRGFLRNSHALLYGGAGLGLSLGTGNWGWMGVAAGAAGGTGLARGLGFSQASYPMLGHGLVGVAAGVATDNPYMAPIGMGASKFAGWMGKNTFTKGWGGAGGLLRGAGNAMIGRGGRGAAIMGQVAHPGWGGVLLGGGIGAGVAGAKIFTNTRIDPTQGYYPGGITAVPNRTGKNMQNDFLSTTGLTLALHKNSRTTPRII